MKILLSDDSKFMRTIVKNILQKMYADAQFLEASNGAEAVETYKKELPDLMLLDLIMPEKGGIEVLKDIASIRKGKVIVVSALGQEKIIEDAKAVGASAFVVKPFDEKMVMDVVDRTMKAV